MVLISYLINNRGRNPEQPHATTYYLDNYQNSHQLFREAEPLMGLLSGSFNIISHISHNIPWLVDNTFFTFFCLISKFRLKSDISFFSKQNQKSNF